MKELSTEVITLAVGGIPKSRLQVSWEITPGWFSRTLLGRRPIHLTAIYVGTGSMWHVLPRWSRVSPQLDAVLEGIEARELRALEARTSFVPPDVPVPPHSDEQTRVIPVDPNLQTIGDTAEMTAEHGKPTLAQSGATITHLSERRRELRSHRLR